MIVFISDLHLTDGTVAHSLGTTFWAPFRRQLAAWAYQASCRSSGYRPIQRMDVVLLGDILDLLRSGRWLRGRCRPWDDWHDRAFQAKVWEITSAILEHNRAGLAHLRALQAPGALTAPTTPVDPGHHPAAPSHHESKGVPIQVYTHYMVGNHDWMYHLPGEPYERVRAMVTAALGLADAAPSPFPHDATESPALTALFRRHRALARHGDVFDPWNYAGHRDAATLGDAIVVELLNRFPAEVTRQLGGRLPSSCLRALGALDRVRPLLLIPAWVEGALRHTCPDSALARQVKAVWDDVATAFLRLPFVRAQDRWASWLDRVDQLEAVLLFSRGATLDTVERITRRLHDWTALGPAGYAAHALTETALRNRSAATVVYGHTHHAEVVPLNHPPAPLSSLSAGASTGQAYLNCGTWGRVYQRTLQPADPPAFAPLDLQTAVAVFAEDEAAGCPFATWSVVSKLQARGAGLPLGG